MHRAGGLYRSGACALELCRLSGWRRRKHQRVRNSRVGFGPGRIRTYDQGIHFARTFPPGVDYLFTRAAARRAGTET